MGLRAMTRPDLYLTNWSSPKLHGPGRKLTIMTHPRHWEKGDGVVPSCRPAADMLLRVKQGGVTWGDLRTHVLARVRGQGHKPGDLWAIVMGQTVPVAAGDTLCCGCSKQDAAEGRCHRTYVAEVLSKAGWRVILDGEDLDLQLF